MVSDWLYRADECAAEGVLSRRRQAIVRTSTLARTAEAITLGEAIYLGRGEERTGGRHKSSLLADTFEAVLGAIYVDGGIRAARAFVRRHLGPAIREAGRSSGLADDYKTLLQERTQARLRRTPHYRIVSTTGPAHALEFECRGPDWTAGSWDKATGSKPQAERNRKRPDKPWKLLTRTTECNACDTGFPSPACCSCYYPSWASIPSAGARQADEPVLSVAVRQRNPRSRRRGLADHPGYRRVRSPSAPPRTRSMRFEGSKSRTPSVNSRKWPCGAPETTRCCWAGSRSPGGGHPGGHAAARGLDVEVFLVGGRLLVSAIGGDLLVEAENSKIQARGLLGDAEFRLTGGVLIVDGVKGDFSVKGTGVQAELQHLYEYADLDLTEGRATLNMAELDVQVTSDRTDLELTRVKGELRVESSGGSLRVSGCAGGGEIQLEETSLTLLNSKGDFTVRTDAMMEFGLHEGSLRVLGYGAPIQGTQIAGPLFIDNNSSSVTLKQLSGRTEIRGTELKLTVEDSKGPLDIHLVPARSRSAASKPRYGHRERIRRYTDERNQGRTDDREQRWQRPGRGPPGIIGDSRRRARGTGGLDQVHQVRQDDGAER